MIDDDIDPVEEVRAVRQKIWQKYKTPAAYFAHLKTIPSVGELLAQIEEKKATTKTKPKRRPAARRRKTAAQA